MHKSSLLYLSSFFSIFLTQSLHANTSTEIEPKTGIWIDHIPEFIDSTPTILPDESQQAIVPTRAETMHHSWIDRTQAKFSNSLQKRAHTIDHWFGEPDPNMPASASIRIMTDTYWNKYDDVSIHPRIRGKIKLPTLKERFSVVFGDDSLDNEIRDNIAISNENANPNANKTFDGKQSRTDNSSLALRWSDFKNPFGIETDADIGIRSIDDIFVRVQLQKDWDLANNFSTHAEQIYRYSIDTKDYLRTNLEIRHARPNQAFLSNQFSLIYTDDAKQELFWDNRLFRQHQFFQDHWFNYGIYLGGDIDHSQPTLNRYGPFVSWRQPVLRDWFFVQTEAFYYNDKPENRDHHLGALLRFETHFK